MPSNQPQIKLPSQITLKTTGSQKSQLFTIHECVGEGQFSDVFRVTNGRGDEFALKAIKLNNPHLSSADRTSMMRLIKKEISALKQLDMLNGYQKLSDAVLILQPYIKGQTAQKRIIDNIDNPAASQWPMDKWDENNKILRECFEVLVKTQQKNIAHMDPHIGNFIYKDKKTKPSLIDFGFAQRPNKYSSIENMAQFFNKANPIAQMSGNQTFIKDLFGIYIDTTLQHIRENKLETAFKIFTYAAFSAAAIYGLGTFAAVRMIMWAYCKTIALDFVTDWFSSALERNQAQLIAQKTLNGAKDADGKAFESGVKHGHIIVASLLFWGIYRGYQNPFDLINKLIALSMDNSVLSQAFWQSAFNAISTAELLNAGLFYYPASNAYKYLSNLFESTFATEKSLATDCGNITYPKTWTSYFSLGQRPSEAALDEDGQDFVNQRTNRL